MLSIGVANNVLKIHISKGEKFDIDVANNVIRKTNRFIVQNRVSSILIEIESSTNHDFDAKILLENTIREAYAIPVVVSSEIIST